MNQNRPEELDGGACCFGKDALSPTPDAAPTPAAIPVPELVRTLDEILERGDLGAALSHLEHWLGEARRLGDWRGELSLQSELIGLHRRTGDEAAAMRAVREGLSLVDAHGLRGTVSGATVMLNAATTLKACGKAKESLPIFNAVCRVYSENLDPGDYRFAGLYNNMALSYVDTGDFSAAEADFLRAMDVLRICPNPENELAVTCCNLAELYGRENPEDGRIGTMLERAWDFLNAPGLPRDGYHAFTISKCAPAFGRFGYFIYESELRKRAEEIYERA